MADASGRAVEGPDRRSSAPLATPASALAGSASALASSASALASGDCEFHREVGREGRCKSDKSFSASGTESNGVGVRRAGPLRRHAAIAYTATAQDETNCKLPITWSTATNDISLLSTEPRISLAEIRKIRVSKPKTVALG